MTHPAGEGLTDAEMAQEVADQTSSDLKAEPEFEEESEGATSDVEAAKDPDKQV
ncbi:MAG: hypothetical protein JWO22_988 [Frankiales bacterium]|nr:hypothetical protein [Frankiales bacterium]